MNPFEANLEIWVIPSSRTKSISGERGLETTLGDKALRDIWATPMKLNVETLSDNLKSFVESMNAMMSRLPAIGEPFRLEEIELAVELNAEGNFQLIGGAKVGVTGGLKLTMKRKN